MSSIDLATASKDYKYATCSCCSGRFVPAYAVSYMKKYPHIRMLYCQSRYEEFSRRKWTHDAWTYPVMLLPRVATENLREMVYGEDEGIQNRGDLDPT